MSDPKPARRVLAARYGIAFGLSAVFMVFAVVTANLVISHELGKIKRVKVATAPAPQEGANYLVIGSDTRAFVENQGEASAFGDEQSEGGQRSDTMMVVHVEPGAKRTLVVSFPRDLWVDIPGQGMAKINAAFNSGPDKVLQTLQVNFGIEINHYIEVDFKSFQAVVRAVGSVPTYFPYPARDTKTNLKVDFGGCIRLDGPTALAYVRSRALEYFSHDRDEWVSVDTVPDISRIDRQQTFIRSLAGLAVAKSLNDPFTALDIAQSIVTKLKADQNLENGEFLDLVASFRTINPQDQSALNMQTFPWTDGPTQDGQSVLYPKDPEWQALVRRLADFSGDKPNPRVKPAEVRLRVLNGSGSDGAARGAMREFTRLGFKNAGTGNDPRGEVSRTEVRYAPGAGDAGRLALSYVEPDARLVSDSTLKGADVVVVLGSDFEAVLRPEGATTTSAATPTTTATTAPLPGQAAPAQLVDLNEIGQPAPRTPPC